MLSLVRNKFGQAQENTKRGNGHNRKVLINNYTSEWAQSAVAKIVNLVLPTGYMDYIE